jgi:hypothetical protein
MAKIIVVRNRATKVESHLDADLYHSIKNTPQWRGVFEYISTIKEPPEVVELKAKKAARKRKPKSGEGK